MQCGQYLYDILLQEKKVIYFCKFTFNPKIIFLFSIPRLWTLFLCVSANHYHSAGAACAGNRHWFIRYTVSQCSGHWICQAGFPAVCQDPKLSCKLVGNSVAEKRSQAWESKQKRSLQQRKMENTAPLDALGAAQPCFLGFALPTGGFLPGCKGGGCEVCVRSPCDISVITVTRRWLTPTVTEATAGLVLCCTRQLVRCVIVRLPFLGEEI